MMGLLEDGWSNSNYGEVVTLRSSKRHWTCLY